MPSEQALETENLTAGYGGPPIIEGVTVKAHLSAVTAIVGLNGSGKSTLLKTIVGLLRPLSGSVKLHGAEVSGLPPEILIRRGICYVPQVGHTFANLTVRENLEMGGFIRKSGVAEKISELCESFPVLKTAYGRQARTLSGGEQHLLGIARALMVDPKVLVLDEPMAGVSPQSQEIIWTAIKVAAASGVAVLLVEQNVREALKRSDWGYVMASGGVVQEGAGPELAETAGDTLAGIYASG